MIPTQHQGKPFRELTKVYIDFEYNKSSEARMNLVCCSLAAEGGSVRNYWLHSSPPKKRILKDYLKQLRTDHIFVAYNVVAEASSFIALGLDPSKFAWIDLQLEYKMLTNHWDKYRYGKHLVKGKEKFTKRPVNKWERTRKDDKDDNSKPETNMASAIYKMLRVKIDTVHKDEMRGLIISDPKVFTPEQRIDILKYCDSDIKYLPKLYEEILNAYRSSTAKRDIFMSEIAWRGDVAARTALMAKTGYPVARGPVTKFANSVKDVLNEIAQDINDQFPEKKLFVWNKKRGVFSKTEQPQRDWIEALPQKERWRKTSGGKSGIRNHSLSLDAYCDHFHYRHEYPRYDFAAQIIRYLKVKQSLNGFMPSDTKSNFFDYYGSDSRARAWLNPYGSQSSRYQPSAKGFIPLKAAWMRSLIRPLKGNIIFGIDYGSEEFLLSAILSGDEKMYAAYASGDPYFHFAKLAKAVPMDAERILHEGVRFLFKSTVLGISYLMAAKGLSFKLTRDTGRPVDEKEAQDLIDKFFNVFSKYADWISKTTYEYSRRGFLKLQDGWVMFGDNPNHRSVSNCPVQGTGAIILRKSIELAQREKIQVIIPLHDALYAESRQRDIYKIDVLQKCMREGFSHYFKDDDMRYEWSKAIRTDIDVWGPGIKPGTLKTPGGLGCKAQTIYVDPRSAKEYERFKKYF